jgi:hypothetical protein
VSTCGGLVDAPFAFGLEAFCDTTDVGGGLAAHVLIVVLAASESACGEELVPLLIVGE